MSSPRLDRNAMKAPWPSPQAPAPLTRFSHVPAREPARPTIAPAAPLARPTLPEREPREPERVQRMLRPKTPPRVRLVQSLSLIVVGVGLGVGVAYTFQDHAPSDEARADFGGNPASLATLVAPSPPVDPVVLRFAWASTCEVAVDGVAHGSIAEIRGAFETAHDQAELFADGIIPSDVDRVLDEAYALIVVGSAAPASATASESPAGLGRRIGDTCRAWSDRIDAAG